MNVSEQSYSFMLYPVFIMLYKVVRICYVDKTPVCDSTFFKFYEFYYACKIESNLYSCIQNRFFLQYH